MLAVRFGPLDLQDACRSLTRLSNLPLHKTTQSGSWKEGHIRMSDSSTITLPFGNKVLALCGEAMPLCFSMRLMRAMMARPSVVCGLELEATD